MASSTNLLQMVEFFIRNKEVNSYYTGKLKYNGSKNHYSFPKHTHHMLDSDIDFWRDNLQILAKYRELAVFHVYIQLIIRVS